MINQVLAAMMSRAKTTEPKKRPAEKKDSAAEPQADARRGERTGK